jgi:hypothetical protein
MEPHIMFARAAQTVIEQAKDVAISRGESQLTLSAMATAMAMGQRSALQLAQCLGISQDKLQRLFPVLQPCSATLPLAQDVRTMLGRARKLVAQSPAPVHPTLIFLPHLVCAVASSLPAAQLPGVTLPRQEQVLQLLRPWVDAESQPPGLGELTQRLRALRHQLLHCVHGQEHAIQQVIEGLFNIGVVGDADTTRQRPAGIFVFAGPPGVGKTFLTRLGAAGAGRAQEETLNALLTEMDGFHQAATRPVIIIAATNHHDLLDAALLRRFSRVIEVELPTRAERQLYLRTRLQAKAQHQVTPQMIERLAAQTSGLAIAALEHILAQASIMALANGGVMTDAILGEAFEKVTMGEAKVGTDPLRTARHEAGHALVMAHTGEPPIYVTIVGRGAFGGYAAFEERDQRRSQTKRELENRICQLLGGREAERLYYGDGGGDSTGPSNDLERAMGIAEAMVYELGMSEEVGFVRIDRHRPLPTALAERCHAAVRGILGAQSIRARGLLTEHRQALNRIVEALMERNRLLKHELLALITDATDKAQSQEVTA